MIMTHDINKEKRKDILKELIEYVEDGKNIRYAYIHEESGDTCYCAIGYMMTKCGIDKDRMLSQNTDGIAYIYYHFPELLQLFDIHELKSIQTLNDSNENEELVSYIKELINKT